MLFGERVAIDIVDKVFASIAVNHAVEELQRNDMILCVQMIENVVAFAAKVDAVQT